MHALQGNEVPTSDAESFVATDTLQTAALIWDWEQPQQAVSNRSFFTKVLPTSQAAATRIKLKSLTSGRYRLQVRRTGFRSNDAYTAYLEMGSPAALSDAQLQRLTTLTSDAPEQDRLVDVDAGGRIDLEIEMRANDIVLVTLRRRDRRPTVDR